MSQSQLESLPKNVLVRLSLKLIDEGVNFQNPHDSFDDMVDAMEKVSKFLGIDYFEILDLEFMSEFIKINDSILSEIFSKKTNKEEKTKLIDSLVIPRVKKFYVDYGVVGSATVTNKYNTNIHSYNENFVKEQFNFNYSEGNFDWWEGNEEETDYSDFETHDVYITYISNPLNESKKNIESLDKEKLMELKKIIDKKLSLL
jgi:hypothetical protein